MAKKLPPLPRGEGTFSWYNEEQGVLRLQKNFWIPHTQTKVRLSVNGKTASECLSKMRDKERDATNKFKLDLDDPSVLVSDGMEQWLQQEKLNRRKATTYDRNECTLKNQIIPYPIGQMKSALVTPRDIKKHLDYLQFTARDGKGYSTSVMKKTYELLDQYFGFIYRENIGANPMNAVPRPEPKKNIGEISEEEAEAVADLEDIILNDAEIKAFRDFVMQSPQPGVVGRSRYSPALYFIMMTCVRVGEACALTWGDIDVEAKNMRINKAVSRVVDRSGKKSSKTKIILTAPKSEQSNRVVRLSDDAIASLLFYKEFCKFTDPKDYVLSTDTGNRASEQHLYKCVKGVLKGAGLSTPARDRSFGVHYLRHTGISFYLRHGIPVELVSKMAGHASIDITLKRYYHIIHDQQDQLLDMMNNISR